MDIVIYNKGVQKNGEDHYFVELMEKKLGVHKFLTSAHVHFDETEDDNCKTSIEVRPINGKALFAEGVDNQEHGAFNLALGRILKQVIKYKEKNFRSSNRNQIDI